MVEWLKQYLNSPEVIKLYNNEHSLECAAEATYWSVQLGLYKYFQHMNYQEIMAFKPVEEMITISNKSDRTNLIRKVNSKLTKVSCSFEASYALFQAAWCVYIHHHSFQKLLDEKEAYDLRKTAQFRK